MKDAATLETRSVSTAGSAAPEAPPTIRQGIGGGRKIAIIALSLVTGAVVGYGIYAGSQPSLERGRAADSARWQGQADLYSEQKTLERGRSADSARWQGQADLYHSEQKTLERGRSADSARLQGLADSYLSPNEGKGSNGPRGPREFGPPGR